MKSLPVILALLLASCANTPRAITISEHEIRLAFDVLSYLNAKGSNK